MYRTAWVALLSVGLGGCAAGGLPEAPQIPEPSAPTLHENADSRTGVTSLLMMPLRVEGVGALSADGSSVSVGAMFATRQVGPYRVGGLALVIRAVGAGSHPVLGGSRRVVLDVDGVRVVGVPDPRLYHASRSRSGVVETLIVPVGHQLLRRMAGARQVKGELGEGVRFELDRRHRSGFASLLGRLPPSARRIGPVRAAQVAPIAE